MIPSPPPDRGDVDLLWSAAARRRLRRRQPEARDLGPKGTGGCAGALPRRRALDEAAATGAVADRLRWPGTPIA